MDSTKIVEILLKFGTVQGQGVADADVEKQLATMPAIKRLVVLKDMMINLRREAVGLQKEMVKHAVGTVTYERYEKQLKAVNIQLRNMTKEMRLARYEVGELKEQLSMVQMGGAVMAGLSAAFFAPLIMSANKYSSAIKDADNISSRWINSMREMETSQMRLGRVATTLLNPAYEKMADTLSSMVGELEKNPKILEVAAMAIGGVGALGTAIAGITTAGKMLLQLQQMSAMTGAAGAMGRAGITLGTVAIYASALIIGTEVGSLIGNAIARQVYGESYKKQNIGDAMMTAAKLFEIAVLTLLQGLQKLHLVSPNAVGNAKEVFEYYNKQAGAGMGASEYSPGGSSSGLTGKDFFAQQNVAMWESYQKQLTALETDTAAQRENIIKQYGERMVQAEENYASNRANMVQQYSTQVAQRDEDYQTSRLNAVANFAAQQHKAEQQYYLQRKQQAQQHNLETRQMEQEHQAEMRKMERDSLKRQADFIADRDAVGLEMELAAHEEQRAEAENQYQMQMQQTNAQFAMQVRQAEQNFRMDQQQRQQEFLADQKQAAEKYKVQKEREAKEFENRLKTLDAAHVKEMTMLQNEKEQELQLLQTAYVRMLTSIKEAFIAQIRQMDASVLNDYGAWQAKMVQMSQDFRSFLGGTSAGGRGIIANVNTGTVTGGTSGSGGRTVTSRASGGRINAGLFQGHDGEFVMNADTVRQAEKRAGGMLTNASLRQVVNGGSNVSITIQSPSGLTLTEVRKIIGTSKGEIMRSIANALPA